ncbi:uncharacterized protein SCHCODRAFT_02374776 [Schizophyllum commune H4-8]|uniref:uncharacterized protein n=1 Tax=Schizophyllum commune (strain H4-8 / FGSC 9210) TaxID=578458 RepID=UPI00215F481D|nr:uncharacterized protein SCHCODRAFT_02374776 [Schizophyllum commune H4-8]KAI5889699.1 hypothetical protein SCHCODRAFT_02374776 [Schizophyllum commune H4-8]
MSARVLQSLRVRWPTMLVLPMTLRSLLNLLRSSSRDPPPQRAGRWHPDEASVVLPPTRSSRTPARHPRYNGASRIATTRRQRTPFTTGWKPRIFIVGFYVVTSPRHWKPQHNEEDRDRLRFELYTGCHDYLGRIANDLDDGDGRAWPLCREQAPGPRSHRDFYPIRVRHTDKTRVKLTEERMAALRQGGGWRTRGKRAKLRDESSGAAMVIAPFGSTNHGRSIKRSAAVLRSSDSRVEMEDDD